MTTRLLLAGVLVFCMAGSGWAVTTYTGQIALGGGAITSPTPGPWSDGILSWVVTEVQTGMWQYRYTWVDGTGPAGIGNPTQKGVSHFTLEVTNPWTGTFQNGWSIAGVAGVTLAGPQVFGEPSNNQTYFFYGLKWDNFPDDVYGFTLDFTVDRAPMWGDAFMKDGSFGQADVWFANLGIGTDTLAAVADGNANGWVLVPNSTNGNGDDDDDDDSGPPAGVIPEPGTLLLLGTGLLGLAGGVRRRSRK